MTGPEGQAAAGSDRVLASNADREQVIEALKDAFVQGRLTRDEFGARAGGALTARTHGELAALTADIPGGSAAGGPSGPPVLARRPAAARLSLVQRRPVTWAIAGSASCLGITLGLVFLEAHVLDPDGVGNSFHPWSSLCALMALVALITGLGIFIQGLSTADAQRRTRRQLPPV